MNLLSSEYTAVRSKGLEYLSGLPGPPWEEMFFVINDPDTEIRNTMIKKLGSCRSIIFENLLLDYILSKEINDFGDRHILNVYRALGRCGSSISIPVLKRKLFEKPLLSYVGKGHKIVRQGAAVALNELKLFEAKELLEKASKSRYSVIVNAYKYAVNEDINVTGKAR
jgi:hypothetical protein